MQCLKIKNKNREQWIYGRLVAKIQTFSHNFQLGRGLKARPTPSPAPWGDPNCWLQAWSSSGKKLSLAKHLVMSKNHLKSYFIIYFSSVSDLNKGGCLTAAWQLVGLKFLQLHSCGVVKTLMNKDGLIMWRKLRIGSLLNYSSPLLV